MSAGYLPSGPEFRVNTHTLDWQYEPAVTALAGGGFVIAWTSDGQDGSSTGIFAQRYDADGTAQGAEFQINSQSANSQDTPAITALTDGGFVVTWASNGQDGSSYGIYGQRYDASGVAQGTEFRVNTYTDNIQDLPSVTALSGGGFVVTWESLGQDGSSYGIFGQRYDANGVAQGAEFQVNSYSDGNQRNPAITALAGGGFVVTWQSFGQDGSSYGIFGKRYDAGGVAVGTAFQVNSYVLSYQMEPAVAALAGGGFVVAWHSDLQDGSGSSVQGQRYDASGVAQGAEFRINIFAAGNQGYPAVTALSDGGYLVTWDSFLQDGSFNGIFGQRYDASGTAQGAEFQINTYATYNQTSSAVTTLPGGGFVVTWSSDRQDGSGYGIYAQRYAPGEQGTPGEDRLQGGAWNDLLIGLAGDDTLIGLDGNDTLDGGSGKDLLAGGAGDDLLLGGVGIDDLRGDAGNDTLDGGTGIDRMVGGDGSDTYYVDNSGDRVYESRNWQGQDLVISSVDFKIGKQHIEDLQLTGSARIGAGNGLMNVITGNDQDNILDGGKNNDTLIGGLGNDTYVLRAPGDTIVELAGEGIDIAKAYGSFVLMANVEKLYMQTVYAKDGTPVSYNGIGNALDNTIVGTPFDNTIIGREGRDVLKGQAGNDTFVFDRALGPNNVDRIIDFEVNGDDDTLKIKGAILGGAVPAGILAAADFALGTVAGDASDRFIFDRPSGQLWFDADGSGAMAQVLVATFEQNADVQADDILVF